MCSTAPPCAATATAPPPPWRRVADILRDAADRLLDRLDDTTMRFDARAGFGGRGVVAPLLRARGSRW